jgi:PAS domain S-box-containing protein
VTEYGHLGFLDGGGEAGALIRGHDWARSPLGTPDTWPQSLRTAVRLMLNTRHPIFLFWGREHLCFYNDAISSSMGAQRRATAICRPGRQVWAEIWHLISPEIDKVMAGEGSTWHENRLVPITRDGRLEDVFWTYSYSPLDDETGSAGVGGVLVMVTETTAQVQAANRLAQDRARQQQLLQQMPGFVAVLAGREHVFEYVNDAYVDISGKRAFLGRTVRQVFPELEGQGFFELLDQVYATGVAYAARATPIRLAGEDAARFIDLLYEPTRDAAGSVTGIFVGGYDVTDRVRADARLRDTMALLQIFTEAVPGVVYAKDRDGRMLVANRGTTELIGKPASFYIGRTDTEFLDDAVQARTVMETDRRIMESGVAEQIEEDVRLADGTPAVWLSTKAPLRGEGGAVIGLIGASVDITARKRAEAALRDSREELRQLNETLEGRVARAITEREHVQEALRQSQKLESMGQLTGGVAHDFNNLLTPIIGSLDILMRRGLGDARERRLMDGAMQAAERAKTLVQRLLAFARRQPLQPIPVDLTQLIGGMAALVGSTVGPRVKLHVEAPGGLPPVRADQNQLEMAILNLAVNARDAMPDGGRLTIAAAPARLGVGDATRAAPGDYVRLVVADTGIGMDEATVSRAVEPFFSTKGIGRGTGLGLSMVHGLAAQLGGALSISSRPGAGTSVELLLPVALPEAAEARPAEAEHDGLMAGTVLLVDDEDLVRASTADMLTELGYAVIEASSAEAALTLVDGGLAPDIVVTDHLMPGLTGTDLARALHERRIARVLIVSGYAEDEGVSPDLPRLNKPFRQTELAAALAGVGA